DFYTFTILNSVANEQPPSIRTNVNGTVNHAANIETRRYTQEAGSSVEEKFLDRVFNREIEG
ncbi:MAG TPA: hypothetical protein VD905_16470, partial [Flavobacteriales bacterium]|nr:hypothetical protein [Flavobacteriales bacterium]